MQKTIYLDNAATTFPKPAKVYEEMDYVNRNIAVNAGRGTYELSKQAMKIIDACRTKMAHILSTDVHNIVFTSSITEALNKVINGINFEQGDNVYVSPYEHNAVLRTINRLMNIKNINIFELPLDEKLEIDIDKLEYMFLKYSPKCVCCTHISNVTGYILPISDIFGIAKRHGAITILDTAQSLGYLDVTELSKMCDFIAFAGHKSLYGPFGIGGFANMNQYELSDYITGGTGSDSLNLNMPEELPVRYEPSSHNITAIAGLNKAIELLDMNENYRHERELTEYAITQLTKVRDIHVIKYDNEKQLSVISFTTDILKSDELGMILNEDYNIAVRTGYHCAAYIHKYLKDERHNGTVRIGLGMFNTKDEIDYLVKAIFEVLEG